VNEPIQEYTALHSTAGYDKQRWNSLSKKLSPISVLQKSDALSQAKCSLSSEAAFCMHSVEGFWGKEEFDVYRVGDINFTLLRESQEESY